MSDQINGKDLGGRDANGRYVKGHKSNGGRAPVMREVRYYDILKSTVTFDDWKSIVERAVNDAKRGDGVARKWLADYLIGPPIERKEVTGAEGEPLKVLIEYAGNADEPT